MKHRVRYFHCFLGKWSMGVALLADAVNPLAPEQRRTMLIRLHDALLDLEQAPEPKTDAWRTLVDATNWLKSCDELGWIEDGQGALYDAKAACVEAGRHLVSHGKVRVGGPGLVALRNIVDQFEAVLGQISARRYWSAVRAAERRTTDARAGRVKPGDEVISL